jgi:predicted RNase H-like HicB family nuclease
MSGKKAMTSNAINADDRIVRDLLKKPYTRLFVPEDDGTFRAEILEFPGCIATGETREEAMSQLEDVAAGWLASSLSQGQSISEPIDNADFSGRIVARFPKSLHKLASVVAGRDGVSLNQLIVASVAQYVGKRSVSDLPAPVSINAYQVVNFSLVGSMGSQSGGVLHTPASSSNFKGLTFLPITSNSEK